MNSNVKSSKDGMEWLRGLRQKIAAECNYDLSKQSLVYRAAAAQHTYNVYKSELTKGGPKGLGKGIA